MKSKTMVWGTLLVLLIAAVAAGCGVTDSSPENGDMTDDEIGYVVIDPQSTEFKELHRGDFKQWYDITFAVEGVHSFVKDGLHYLLISAGERPTGGYYLEDLVLVGTEKEIEVTVRLRVPAPGEQVTEAITYPHLLVQIPEDDRPLVYGGCSGPGFAAPPKDTDTTGQAPRPDGNSVEHTDSGRLIGWIDSNSVEIHISGVPDEIGPRVFRLSAAAREQLQQQGIEDGEVVLFIYIVDGETHTITKIKRLQN